MCTTQTANKIFDMVRAVTERNQKRALELYYDLLTLKEPPMRILFLLAKQFHQLFLAKKMAEEGERAPNAFPIRGARPLFQEIFLPARRSYSSEELRKAEEDFVEAEEAVKTGRLQDVLSVES